MSSQARAKRKQLRAMRRRADRESTADYATWRNAVDHATDLAVLLRWARQTWHCAPVPCLQSQRCERGECLSCEVARVIARRGAE